jgi:putative cell wall-binding protein
MKSRRISKLAFPSLAVALTAGLVVTPMTAQAAQPAVVVSETPAAAPAAAAPAGAGTGYADPVDGTTGTPLGGFGAGGVKFDAKTGTFAAITQAPADQNDYVKAGTSRFQLVTDRGGEIAASDTMTAVVSNGRTSDDAIWPEHLVDFAPVGGIETSMTAFAPMDGATPDNMSMPYAFYSMTVTNTGTTAADAAIALNWDQARAKNPKSVEGRGFTSDGWAVYATTADEDAVVTSGNDAGFLTSGVSDDKPTGTSNRTSVKVGLAPAQSTTVNFVLAWYDTTDPDGSYYLSKYDGVTPIAELGVANFDALKANADTFVERMRGSNVPSWFVNQTVNSLANMSNNSIYKTDGRTAFAEGEWTTFGTMDQMWHAREVVGDLFPTFAWQELEYWARTQRNDGQIHHDFNYMADTSLKYKLAGWDDTEHADYRSVDKWVDLNAGFIVSIFETYQATGDDTELDYFWPYMKKAGQRIFDQLKLYGDPKYPGTFHDSENSYDAGGDPNAFNSSMSAVAYKVMRMLADERGETGLAATYQGAYDTAVKGYEDKYLTDNFPVGRISEGYFTGQWLAMHLKLGEVWPASDTDYVLSRLDSYYHPLYYGLGNPQGTYDEWTPYMLAHYGGLLLNTRRANQYEAMQLDAYNRQYKDRNYVFNMPLDILPVPKTVNYSATSISGDKQYISTPTIWRNYDDVVGYNRDQSTGDLWVQPKLLPSMDHVLTNGTFVSPEGYGSVDYTESGDTFQNQELTVRSDQPIDVTTLHLQDYFGDDTSSITVTVDGAPVPFTRSGEGYTKELLIELDCTVDSDGVVITATGDAGAPLPADPEEPEGGVTPPTTAEQSAYAPIQAEKFSATGGVTAATEGTTGYITGVDDQDYSRYDGVGFDAGGAEAIRLTVRSTKASTIEFATGSVSGATLADLPIPNTEGEWQTITIDLPQKVTGTQNVVFRYRSVAGDSSQLMDLDSVTFLRVGYKTTLDRSVWKATASINGTNAGAAFDDNPSTRWNSQYQVPGDQYVLDTGSVQSFDRIVLDGSAKSANDYPRAYSVSVSEDGTDYGQPVATGVGTPSVTTIRFARQDARYIKIVQTGSAPANYWSIEELNVYNDPADVSALLAELAATEKLDEPDYTPETWAPLASARTAAQAVVDDYASTQAQADAALTALQQARAALVAADNPVTSIAVTTQPKRTTYIVGEQFDPAGLVVTATLANGATKVIPADGYTLNGFDGSMASTQTITVTLTADPTKTAAFPVTVAYSRALSRIGWTATASPNGNAAAVAFDGNGSTRWNSSFQKPGDQYVLNLGSPQTFNRVALDNQAKSANDFPHGYEVYVSSDGKDFGTAIATGTGTPKVTTITFPTQTAQYIKIVQTGTESAKYWSIEELYVYLDPDLAPLQTVVDAATPLVSEDYTADSWAVFSAALAEAQAVLADPASAQPVVDAAAARLAAAQQALVRAEEEPPAGDPVTDRIAGADRFEVSVNTSKAGFPDGSDTVYVASGEVFPDALSAAPAATVAGAPILLTTATQVPASVTAEIARLHATKIVIVGGPATVSTAVEDSLKELGTVSRIGGADRFEASRNIAQAAFPDGADVAVLASGTAFADALSSGAAIDGQGPVVLVDGSKPALDQATTALLTDLGVAEIVIAGGEASMSKGIETAASELADTVRLGGADRYEASRAINAHFFTEADHVLVATGEKFPDALSGSAFAPRIDAPLFTAHGDCVPAETLSQIAALGATKVTLLGGPATLNEAVENLTACQ